jgi:ABC-type Fe3+/spermidine/putrescine transport system ATPase subunit
MIRFNTSEVKKETKVEQQTTSSVASAERQDGIRSLQSIDLAAYYGGRKAIRDVSLTFDPGAITAIIGPSGCGKSTLIRCLNRMHEVAPGATVSGKVLLDGEDIYGPGVSPVLVRRRIGMVFQRPNPFPTMSIFDNVAAGLRLNGVPVGKNLPDIVWQSLQRVALWDEVKDKLRQPGTALSGGQQQRLALARALVRKPRLLLLDEPLSNLDAKLRERMRIDLRELQRRLRITTVYVTHDQSEALFLSHRIAVMHDGRIAQEGSPREIYGTPASGFVADFVGMGTFLPAEVAPEGVRALGQLVRCRPPAGLAPSAVVQLALRPENVIVRHQAEGRPNEFSGTLVVAAFMGDHLDCLVDVGGELIRARMHPTSGFTRGQQVWIEIPPEQCVVLHDDGWRPRPFGRSYEADVAEAETSG